MELAIAPAPRGATATSGIADVGSSPRQSRIVVGVDSSPSARQALVWAVEETNRRHGQCQVIEVWTHGASGMVDPWATPDVVDEHLAAVVNDVCSQVKVAVPADVGVRLGDPIEILAEAARHADLLVVGSRGHGVIKDFVLGSVSATLLRLGICPTVVIPPGRGIHAHHSRVVVGIDGSEQGARALLWARDEAVLRRAELVVLHAWHMPIVVGSIYAPTCAVSYPECQEEGQKFLDQAVSAIQSDDDLSVVPRLIDGMADHELVKAAAHADLLVVGSRGRSEIAATVLGSTSRWCVHHAPCPVSVIP